MNFNVIWIINWINVDTLITCTASSLMARKTHKIFKLKNIERIHRKLPNSIKRYVSFFELLHQKRPIQNHSICFLLNRFFEYLVNFQSTFHTICELMLFWSSYFNKVNVTGNNSMNQILYKFNQKECHIHISMDLFHKNADFNIREFPIGNDIKRTELRWIECVSAQHFSLKCSLSHISTLKRIYCKRSFQHASNQSINQSLFSASTHNCNHIYFKWMTLQKINFKMDFFPFSISFVSVILFNETYSNRLVYYLLLLLL